MLVKVCKHGNSLSIRLGAYITRTAHINKGDKVEVFLLPNGEIRIRPQQLPSMFTADATPDSSDQQQPPVVEQW